MALETADLMKRRAPALVERLLPDRFADADFAFVAGSVMRGTATPSSDIDLVVIHSRLPHAHRQSLLFENVPIEAFVHDHGTLRWFLDADVRAGRPVLIRMVAEGFVVGPRPDGAEGLRREARALLANGPTPLDAQALDRMRYVISDLLTDLLDERPDSEQRAVGVSLYPALADFVLRANGRWSGAGKWLPRQISELDPPLAMAFHAAFETLFVRGDATPILHLAKEILAPHGGLLFDGYRSDAPPDRRIDGQGA